MVAVKRRVNLIVCVTAEVTVNPSVKIDTFCVDLALDHCQILQLSGNGPASIGKILKYETVSVTELETKGMCCPYSPDIVCDKVYDCVACRFFGKKE